MSKEYVVIYWRNSHKYSVTIKCYNVQEVLIHMYELHKVPSGNIVEIKEV